MKVNNRKSAWESLKRFSPLYKEEDFIEVTEWSNGEGWDITINDKHISLHMDELEAINYMTKHVDLYDE